MGRIAPFMGRRSGRQRGRGGAQFGGKSERIGLERAKLAVGADDLEFVGAPLRDIGNENLPHADIGAAAHDMAAPVPIIEIAYHRDTLGIGGPDREMNAAGAFMRDEMRAHLVVEPPMGARRDQKVVNRAQHRAETVGIGDPPLRAIAARLVFDRRGRAQDLAFEQSALVTLCQRPKPAALEIKGLRAFGAGYPDPRESPARPGMGAQQGEGIRVASFQQGIQRARRRFHKMPQISLAYSRMVRSEENQPILAMLCTAAADQAPRWRQCRCRQA